MNLRKRMPIISESSIAKEEDLRKGRRGVPKVSLWFLVDRSLCIVNNIGYKIREMTMKSKERRSSFECGKPLHK